MLESRIREIVGEFLGEENQIDMIDGDYQLSNVGLNSIGFINMIVVLEDTFHITVEDDELLMRNFATINKIKGYLNKKGIEGD